ncbi:unnamed protein product, partial [Ectocarpus sp. 12 AP-2014]
VVAPRLASNGGGSGGGVWPTRTTWIPNGFADEAAYRRVFSRAMQEEMQLMLDEAVVTRFEKAKANLATIASSGSGSGSSSGRGG